MTTAADLAALIGRTGDLHATEVHPTHHDTGAVFRVRVLDARRVWNRTDYLVTPIAGSGEQWVAANRVDNLADGPAGATTERKTDAEIEQGRRAMTLAGAEAIDEDDDAILWRL